MTELKLKRYQEIDSNLITLLGEFNQLTVTDAVSTHIHGLPVIEIDAVTVLRAQARDKASTLTNYKEMLAVGVDLATIIDNCEVSESILKGITELASVLKNGVFDSYLQYISYEKKAKQFVINTKGKQYLEENIIKLTGEAERIYNQVVTLYSQLAKTNTYFAAGVLANVNELTGELYVDTLVKTIQKYTAKS